MSESLSRTDLTELAEHREARVQEKLKRQALEEKLGTLVGATIDISGYPYNAHFKGVNRTGDPILRAVSVYPIVSDEPRQPVSWTNRTLEKADGRYIWVSRNETGVPLPEPNPDSLGQVVSYTFDIENILDLKVVETPDVEQEAIA